MRRITAIGLLLTTMAGCIPMGELGASTPALGLVPDPSYRPREGDRAFLYAVENGSPAENVPVLSDVTSYDRFERASKSADDQELSALVERNWLQYTPTGTRVFIAKLIDRGHTGARVAAEVRLLDGPMKGRTVLTPVDHVVMLGRPVAAE